MNIYRSNIFPIGQRIAWRFCGKTVFSSIYNRNLNDTNFLEGNYLVPIEEHGPDRLFYFWEFPLKKYSLIYSEIHCHMICYGEILGGNK